eukprot:SAG25_NODE_7314_length_488_cov_15.012853_1_plen_90_part_10
MFSKGLSYGSSFSPNGIPAPQANFFKEYSRYTFKKSALLSKEEGTPEIISRPAFFFLKSMPHDDPPTSNLLQWPKIQSSPNERVTAHVCH